MAGIEHLAANDPRLMRANDISCGIWALMEAANADANEMATAMSTILALITAPCSEESFARNLAAFSEAVTHSRKLIHLAVAKPGSGAVN